VVSGPSDVVVVGVAADDRMDARLREARSRAAGAAVVVVMPPQPPNGWEHGLRRRARLSGPRAGGEIGRVVASTASRRRAEVMGRQLVETLAVLESWTKRRARARPRRPRRTGCEADRRHRRHRGRSRGPSAHEVPGGRRRVVVLTVLREILRRAAIA